MKSSGRIGIAWLISLLLLALLIMVPFLNAAKPVIIDPDIKKVDLTAANYLKEYIDWCKTKDGNYNYFLGFAAVTNNANGVASYTEGRLNYDANQDLLIGEGIQYYNYRRWGGMTQPYPFDTKQTDKVQFTLTPTGVGTITNQVSNGKGPVDVAFHSENKILFGFTTKGFPTYWVVSLKKQRVGIVK